MRRRSLKHLPPPREAPGSVAPSSVEQLMAIATRTHPKRGARRTIGAKPVFIKLESWLRGDTHSSSTLAPGDRPHRTPTGD
jgi:hypothetical protein